MADQPPSSSDPASATSTSQAPTAGNDAMPDAPPALSEPPSQPTQPLSEDSKLEALPEQDIDAEINLSASNPTSNSMTLDGASDPPPPPTSTAPIPESNGLNAIPSLVEPRIPQKKDTSLREFLGKMDDYAPLIPDAVTDYYLTLAGLPPPPETDRRLARLLALATQKFIADIAADAYQYSRIRSTNTTSNNPLTGLGGAAGFGMNVQQANAGPDGGEATGGKGGKKDAGKAGPLGGPRAGYGGGGAGGGQGRTVLTMEDLGMAVGEYGVNVKRGEFYR